MLPQNQTKGNNQLDQINFKYRNVRSSKTRYGYGSFTFNANFTILFVGSEQGKIKVYGFNNKQKLIHTLQNQEGIVYNLIFIKKSKSLVSTNNDNLIIWYQGQNNIWKPQQVTQGHSDKISCMIINEQEDLLATGSDDLTIKIWKEVNSKWNCEQDIVASIQVKCLSFNISSTKLIMCGLKCEIINVFEKQNNQFWIITQTIQTCQWGMRLCFINENHFSFQPFTKEFMEIYVYEQESKQFVRFQQILVQSCESCLSYFPPQFIRGKNILIVKHGCYTNIFGIFEKDNYVLQQSIKFNNALSIFGRLTNDGAFFVTWDLGSKKMQINKLIFQN